MSTGTFTQLPTQPPTQNQCEWVEDDDSSWFAECGYVYAFALCGPRENLFLYCPHCGRRIKATYYNEGGK